MKKSNILKRTLSLLLIIALITPLLPQLNLSLAFRAGVQTARPSWNRDINFSPNQAIVSGQTFNLGYYMAWGTPRWYIENVQTAFANVADVQGTYVDLIHPVYSHIARFPQQFFPLHPAVLPNMRDTWVEYGFENLALYLQIRPRSGPSSLTAEEIMEMMAFAGQTREALRPPVVNRSANAPYFDPAVGTGAVTFDDWGGLV